MDVQKIPFSTGKLCDIGKVSDDLRNFFENAVIVWRVKKHWMTVNALT